MSCHFCQADAVSRCYNCGELVCEEHGKSDVCPRCSGGFVAGDPRADRISVTPMTKEQSHGWWRPQVADEYQPPACYECKGLTRAVCRNCQANYCREHAGPPGLCIDCGRSANFALYLVAGMMGLIAVVLFLNWLLN